MTTLHCPVGPTSYETPCKMKDVRMHEWAKSVKNLTEENRSEGEKKIGESEQRTGKRGMKKRIKRSLR